MNPPDIAAVADLIAKIEEAANAIHDASDTTRADLHPDLLAKADEIAAMLDVLHAA